MKIFFVLSLGVLLASCGQPPRIAVEQQAAATPAPTQQPDFSGLSANPSSEQAPPMDAEVASIPTPTPLPTAPSLQFKTPEAQAAFNAYLLTYRQLMNPPKLQTGFGSIPDPNQINQAVENLKAAGAQLQQSEANLKGILSPNELRQFRAYQSQLANPPEQ